MANRRLNFDLPPTLDEDVVEENEIDENGGDQIDGLLQDETEGNEGNDNEAEHVGHEQNWMDRLHDIPGTPFRRNAPPFLPLEPIADEDDEDEDIDDTDEFRTPVDEDDTTQVPE